MRDRRRRVEPDADRGPTPANNTDAGTATASYTFAGDANHTGSSDSKTFAIGQASSITTVTIGGPFTSYRLAAHARDGVTGAGGFNLTPTADYSDNTNAGTATASYTFAGDANHTGSCDSKNFTIDKATLHVDALNASKTYGDLDPAFAYHLSGFVNFENPGSAGVVGVADCTRTNNDQDAGLYEDVITCDPDTLGAPNYAFATGASADFTIDKASSYHDGHLRRGPITYTGHRSRPCSVSGTGAGGLSLTPDPHLQQQHQRRDGNRELHVRGRRQPHRQLGLGELHDRQGVVDHDGHLRRGPIHVHGPRHRRRARSASPAPAALTYARPPLQQQHRRRDGNRDATRSRASQPHRQLRLGELHHRQGVVVHDGCTRAGPIPT